MSRADRMGPFCLAPGQPRNDLSTDFRPLRRPSIPFLAACSAAGCRHRPDRLRPAGRLQAGREEGHRAGPGGQLGPHARGTAGELPGRIRAAHPPRAVPRLHQALDRRRGHLPAGPEEPARRRPPGEAQPGQAHAQAAHRGVPGPGESGRGLRARRDGHEPVLRDAQGGVPPQGAGDQVRASPRADSQAGRGAPLAHPDRPELPQPRPRPNPWTRCPSPSPPCPTRSRTSCPPAWPRTWPRPASGPIPRPSPARTASISCASWIARRPAPSSPSPRPRTRSAPPCSSSARTGCWTAASPPTRKAPPSATTWTRSRASPKPPRAGRLRQAAPQEGLDSQAPAAPMEALGTPSGPEIDPAPRPKARRRPATGRTAGYGHRHRPASRRLRPRPTPAASRRPTGPRQPGRSARPGRRRRRAPGAGLRPRSGQAVRHRNRPGRGNPCAMT